MARIPFKAGSQKSFTPMPKGTYLLCIDNVEEHTSQVSGKPSLKVTHLVDDHPTYAGRKVIRFFSLSEKATFRLRAMLEAAIPDRVEIIETDEKNEDGDPMFNVDFDTDDLIGARYYCDASIKYNKDRGEEEQVWSKERPFETASAASEEDEVEEGTSEEDQELEQQEAPPPAQAKATAKPAQQSAAKPNGTKPQQAPASTRDRARLRA